MITAIKTNINSKPNTQNKTQVSMTGISNNLLKTDMPPETEKSLLELAEDFSRFVGKMMDKALGTKRIFDKNGNLASIKKFKKGALIEEISYKAGKIQEKTIYNADDTIVKVKNDEKGKLLTLLDYRANGKLGKQEIYSSDGKFIRTMYDAKTGEPFLITAHDKNGKIIKCG